MARSNTKGSTLPATRNDFLAKVREGKAKNSLAPSRTTLVKAIQAVEKPRLLCAIDATASREHTWDIASEITSSMFEVVPNELDVALAYHGGGRMKELTKFSANTKAFLKKVRAVRCEPGLTALNEILDEATRITGLKAIIYIGDAFEEESWDTYPLVEQLRLRGVRCFMFHDTGYYDPNLDPDMQTARRAFQMIADKTNGAVLPFDENAPEKTRELLEAIAVYAVGGVPLLEQRRAALPGAQVLLTHMRN